MSKPPITSDSIGAISQATFDKIFTASNERGAALSCVAYLDAIIADHIKLIMVDDSDAITQMFGEQGSLGGFGSRVRFSYLLGLVDKFIYRELLTINKIRNAFAHRINVESFSSPEVQDHVSNLAIINNTKVFATYIAFYFGITDLEPERVWEAFSSLAKKRSKDVTLPPWAFAWEVAVLHSCFYKSYGSQARRPAQLLFP